jgi:hypothetical protein
MTATLSFSRAEYMSNHVWPGWNETVFLSADKAILLSFSKLIVMPPSMFDPPGTAECPPLFAANGHCVNREMSIEVETSNAFSGLKMHWGVISRC